VIVLAQEDSGTSFFDNDFLDQWEIPFGSWFDQAVDWIDNNLQTLLEIIEWPFETLINWLVDDILVGTSWVWVVLAMGLIGTLMRNIKVGAFVVVALTTCGLLGAGYWTETARTIGFIAVAVIVCVIIGIPVGIAAGRVDGFWKGTRPILDAMQVVHSFVYMIPFIFFWGVGEVSATMVTMIFAIPPLIRLTNLGIRQVPDDVVEAARAQGAPEWRVLFDVQIPLARPAIMTGINQTLLLAISMLGIAAIMGAGGLGRLLFRSLSNQDIALAASAGLAFFLVAVVLDRISQREGVDEGNFFKRIGQAWAHRRDPEVLLPDGEAALQGPLKVYEPITSREKTAMLATLVGGVVAVVSVFLPWTENAGLISAYGNRADEDLPGMVFNGLDASGGSFFGIIVLVFGLFVVAAVAGTFLRPGRGAKWLSVDGALLTGLAGAITAGAFLVAQPANLAVDPGTGVGVIVAVIGGVIAIAGALSWIRIAPHTPLHPLAAGISKGQLIGVGLALLVIVAGAFAGWSFDERTDVIISAELQEEIDDLKAQAEADPSQAAVIANTISGLIAQAQATSTIVIDGVSDDGAQLGIWTMLLGLITVGTSLPAAGVFGSEERRRWIWSSITAGVGAGIASIAFAWIFTFVRNADPSFIAGIGAFMTMMGGVFILASNMSVLQEFRRSRVYDDKPAGSQANLGLQLNRHAGRQRT
jgi:glycine betaine/proline transport system permease protein